jgi:hypothetical protein
MKHLKYAYKTLVVISDLLLRCTDETLATYVREQLRLKQFQKHMQHPDETLANICMEKQIKHSEHTLETYMYSHCNICNIPIHFCNIKMKHLQHPDKTSETLETYLCNMSFHRNVIFLLGLIEACRCGAQRRRMELIVH